MGMIKSFADEEFNLIKSYLPILTENQIEKKMENETESWGI